MKKYITLLFLIAAIGASAQTRVTSVALGDQIWLPRGAVEIAPIPINMAKDSVRTMSYTFLSPRDTTAVTIISVFGYDKNGTAIYNTQISLVGTAYRKWKSLITPLDSYISTQLKRITQLTQ